MQEKQSQKSNIKTFVKDETMVKYENYYKKSQHDPGLEGRKASRIIFLLSQYRLKNDERNKHTGIFLQSFLRAIRKKIYIYIYIYCLIKVYIGGYKFWASKLFDVQNNNYAV